MLVGKYWVGCGGQKNPSLACKQLHVGAEECQELFLFWGWVGHLLWQSEDLLTPFKCLLPFFQASSWKERGKEGRSVGRKGGKKWKHLSRRAEAIRNACWVSKTENREKGIKIKSSVKKKDEVGKGFAILWKEGPGQSIILCQVPFRLDKVNITTWWKRDKGGWTDGGKSAPGSSVWSCIYETMKMKRRLYVWTVFTTEPPALSDGWTQI